MIAKKPRCVLKSLVPVKTKKERKKVKKEGSEGKRKKVREYYFL